jgi:hypothetical protein
MRNNESWLSPRLNDLEPLGRLAPRTRRLRTARRAAYKRHGEVFFDQDRANVAAVGLQRAAVATVVARLRPFRPCGARTVDIDEVEIALLHQIANPSRGFRSKLALLHRPLAVSQAR